MDAINIILLLCQVFNLYKMIVNLKNNFMDFSAYFGLLYSIFFVPVFWDMYLGLNTFKYVYEISYEYNIFCSKEQLTFYNLISFLITIAFEIGYSFKRKGKKQTEKTQIHYNEKNYKIIQIALFLVWISILVYEITRYSGSLIMFFLPSTKHIITSSYIKLMLQIIPIAMFTIKVCKDNTRDSKNNSGVWFYILLILVTNISNSQRRETISSFLYIILVLTFVKTNIKEILAGIYGSKYFKKIMRYGLICILMVVFLWYSRVLLNQMQDGRSSIVKPWEIRSFTDILYGSSATGFPTLIAMGNFFENRGGIPYFRNIIYLFESIIPRSLYPNKMLSLTEYMQDEMNSSFNLSLFYVCDMYYTFGSFSVFFSFIFGYIFSKIYNANISKENFRYNYFSLLMLSQIVLLYKNGFIAYIITLLFYRIIIEFIMKRIFYEGKYSINE